VNPQEIAGDLVRESPRLLESDTIGHAVTCILEAELPALPVTDEDGRLVGIFGEREFMSALFPGYVGELGYAGFVSKTLDDAIDQRAACRNERVGDHLNREHVEVSADFSDLQLAETFLHHRVLIVPVLDGTRLAGIVTRKDFFRRIAARVIQS
jgi:CBS domain-containing protein